MKNRQITHLLAVITLLIVGLLTGAESRDYKGSKRGSATLVKRPKLTQVPKNLWRYMSRDGANFKYEEVTLCEMPSLYEDFLHVCPDKIDYLANVSFTDVNFRNSTKSFCCSSRYVHGACCNSSEFKEYMSYCLKRDILLIGLFWWLPNFVLLLFSIYYICGFGYLCIRCIYPYAEEKYIDKARIQFGSCCFAILMSILLLPILCISCRLIPLCVNDRPDVSSDMRQCWKSLWSCNSNNSAPAPSASTTSADTNNSAPAPPAQTTSADTNNSAPAPPASTTSADTNNLATVVATTPATNK
ncbi:hypothetical protein BOX15_Mlig031209g1 [Macrostomum lignano]|uniref:CX domain-containing protein n=1 Tax=Macrostomum lignano TaxID=282301 RepID=A0A267ETG3_9PLAT|nr:hypothetical protein BOX15_Mlig031209g1 [Macrostomum lignano]